MVRDPVSSPDAPKAIGPYSQAIVTSGKLVFCSGQIPIDPRTGEITGAGDVKAETHRVMLNLKAVLEAAGSSLDQVVKTTIFLTDLQNFGHVNEVYAGYFKSAPPARATVQVAGLPKGAQVEIEAVAVVGP